MGSESWTSVHSVRDTKGKAPCSGSTFPASASTSPAGTAARAPQPFFTGSPHCAGSLRMSAVQGTPLLLTFLSCMQALATLTNQTLPPRFSGYFINYSDYLDLPRVYIFSDACLLM